MSIITRTKKEKEKFSSNTEIKRYYYPFRRSCGEVEKDLYELSYVY